jgi:methylated-DNA-[protein]-cysteine S-methyltransferase
MHASPDFDAILPAPFGALGVSVADDCLIGLDFLPAGTAATDPSTPLLQRVANELNAYFAHAGHRFDLPIAPRGTPFRRQVWTALLAIPVGQTLTYGELARQLATGPRAVGQAVGDNPIPILIPCHRVVASHRAFNDGLGGLMHSRTGFCQDIKRWLLRHERAL